MNVRSPSSVGFSLRLLVLAVGLLSPGKCRAQFLEILPSTPTVMQGTAVTLNVVFDNDTPSPFSFAGTQIYILFDNSIFTPSAGQLYAPISTFSNYNFITFMVAGQVTIAANNGSTEVPLAANSSTTLASFVLTASGSAPLGASLVDLVATAPGGGHTAMFNGSGMALTLNPAPQNGQDANDSVITINAAVPEPGPLVFLGVAATVAGLIGGGRAGLRRLASARVERD